MDIQDMLAELEEYYETAGFADFYERVLKDLSDEQIEEMYLETFQDSERRNY